MASVFKKELYTYFTQPIGYVFLSVYYLFSGFFFYKFNLYTDTNNMTSLFEMLFSITIFLIPILTMRLFSEEKKTKTDQLLYMCPIKSLSIVIGKYLAALVVYLVAIFSTFVMAIILKNVFCSEFQVVLGHIIGLFLLGATLIAIGMFVSSLTENQIIAAVGGFCIGFFLMMLDSAASSVSNSTLGKVLNDFSFQVRYRNFTLGLIDLSDVIFFVSFSAFFIFLTNVVFNKNYQD